MAKKTNEAKLYQTLVLHGVTHVVLPVSDLYIDSKTQRDESESQVADIVCNFDWEFVNEPLVCKDSKTGKYKSADGQHTIASIRKKFGDNETVLCRVTTKPAHKAFIQQNSNRRAVTNNAKFWANLGGGEYIETTIQKICEKHGITLQKRGRPGINATRAVAKLRDLWDVVGGEDGFTRIIMTVSACYRRPDGGAIEMDALTALFFEGLAKFYSISPYRQCDIEYALHRSKVSSADIIKYACENACSNSTRFIEVAEYFKRIVGKYVK